MPSQVSLGSVAPDLPVGAVICFATLIRIRVGKAEAGSLDQDMASAGLLTEDEARIAALERLVGRQALEIEFLKGARKSAPSPRNAPVSATSAAAVPLSNGGVR